MIRTLPAALLVLVMSACQPSLPYTPPPTSVVTAVFDPLTAKIPLPNDLALPPFNDPNTVCPPPANMLPAGSPPGCAQAELLHSFSGLFPGDQEVVITIDFTQTNLGANGQTTQVAPDLDLASFTPSTFFVYGSSPPYQGEVTMDPLQAGDYKKFDDHGTLTLHHQGHAPWLAGTYAVLVRGGPDGVKTTDKTPVYASQVFDLVAQGQDMTDEKNLGLLKAQTGSTAAALAQGRQLNVLIGLYKASAYPFADTRFPHQELAIVTTFKIGSVTNVTIDPARGLAPLPIDLLRDPASGKLSALAACTLVGAALAADGTCPSPAAAGFLALDGFSTTGAILAPTSELIQANTVTKTSLMLYDLTDPAHPAQVNPDSLILEPCEFTSSCKASDAATALSPVIAIQPAGATALDPPASLPSVFRTRPLKDNTDYAVVITTAIRDKAGSPIGAGTVANVLRFTNPITVGGHSALIGIDDATAAGLEKMRLQLAPVFGTLAAAGTDRTQVAIAYTFHTQTILDQANRLAALPYSTPAATAQPAAAVVPLTPGAAFTKYGVDAPVPSGHIDEILETDIVTFNALDPATGAFLADPTKAVAETIHVLIATPKAGNAKVPACTGGLAPFGKCAPMMVFRHGLGRGRLDLLSVADTNAEAGMVTVAIDAAKHGDRAFCTSGTSGAASGCIGGGACTTSLPAGAQGDVNPPGTCAAGFLKRPVSPTCTGACAASATDGIPVVSGNYLVSGNFFRTRDTMRQDLIDESQLVRAIAFAPSGALPTGHAVFDHMAARGLVIDPATIYFSGQSLGSIQGTMDVATNPRISKAVFNVGGGTIVDIFTNSPAFTASTDRLLAGLGIQRGTASFLQFLVVAKTVLDPADPINYAGHLTANTLPNLLAGGAPQAAKKVLTQVANCDAVVPNPFSFVHASNVPTAPLPPTGAPGTFQLFVSAGFTPNSCAAGTVEHGFLTDWVTPALTLKAQTDLASFVMLNTLPPSIQQ
jgi:hypothetical protein